MLVAQKASFALRRSLTRLISTLGNRRQQTDPLQATLTEDQCILVDGNDTPVGEASKTDCHLVSQDGKILLHRAFSVFLFNSKGELLLQKRSSEKVTYPNHYTNTCCSHPLSSIPKECMEDGAIGIRHAAQRRLQYELGIPTEQVRLEEMHYLTRIHYFDQGDGTYGEHEIDYIIFLQKNVDVNPNPSEVSDVRYVKKGELKSVLTQLSEPLTPWFKLIAKHHLQLWWDNLHQLHKFSDHNNIHRFL